MKNFWKIRNNADIEKCLHYLKVDFYYIEIILDPYSDFIKYLNMSPKPKYVYILYDFKLKRFGWTEDDDYVNCILQIENNKYCGEINLRKQKLEKLKEYAENR